MNHAHRSTIHLLALLLVVAIPAAAGAQDAQQQGEAAPMAQPPEPLVAEEGEAEEGAGAGEQGEQGAPAPGTVEVQPMPMPAPETLAPVAGGLQARANAPEPVVNRDYLNAAMVEYRTAWQRGVGFLVGDQRTVIVVDEDLRDRHRRISVRMIQGDNDRPEVDVVEVRRQNASRFSEFVILRLEEDLPGTPLPISPEQPNLTDTVLILNRVMDVHNRPPAAIEVAWAAVTASSQYTITVGTSWSQIWHGSPVFDERGRLVAFFGNSGFAMRIGEILADVNHHADRQLFTPVIGLRLGTEFGGFLDNPLTVELEFGMAIWDQLGIMFFLGGGLDTEETMSQIPEGGDRGQGVAQSDLSTFYLGLEVEYRLLLTRTSMPFYLDFSFGVQYTMYTVDYTGSAFYSSQPGCDPSESDCGLIVGEPPNRDVTHAVALSVGADLRAGPFVIGYRFIPEGASFNQPNNTHRLNFGISWR